MSRWLPLQASEHAAEIDLMLNLTHALIAAAFLAWFGAFVFILFRFRRARQPKASYHPFKSRIPFLAEGTILAAEIALLAGLSIPFWMRVVDARPEALRAPVEVRIVAQQFVWNVHHPGPDGVFGRVKGDLVDGQTNPVGLDRTDPDGMDDIVTVNHLYLPVGEPALIWLTSMDVIHSLALPEFRVKRDAIPGMSVPVMFTPTMTTAELREHTGDPNRNFEIKCAQLCGLGHYNMRGFLTVLEPQEYRAWVADNAPTPEDAAAYDPFWD